MQYEEQGELLTLLADIQRKSAPIELSIGWVDKNNTVQRGIVIRSAPPTVARKPIEEGYSLEVTKTGIRVYKI